MTANLLFPAMFCIGYPGRVVAVTDRDQFVGDAGPEGSITLLCGANGSGKTTLLRTLAGIIPPLRGEALLGPVTLGKLKKEGKICYLPEVIDFCGQLEGEAVLRLLTPATPVEIKVAMDRLEVSRGVAFARLSKGNKQKIRFLAAWLNARRSLLLLMDEPFSGLDIETRETAMEMLSEMFRRDSGRRLVISLHTEQIPGGWCDSSLGITGLRILGGPAFTSVYCARRHFLPHRAAAPTSHLLPA